MGEHVRAEQRPRRTVVEPARGDQADRRLHDIDRPAVLSELDRVRPGHRNDLHRFQDAPAVRLGAEIEPQRRIDIAGVALLDVEVPGERFHVVDRHELVQPQREQRQRQGGRDQRLDLGADRRLVLAEAGVDQHGGVALRQQVAVRHRKSARAGRIGADPAVERIRVLQGVELAFGERRDPGRFASVPRRRLRRCRHLRHAARACSAICLSICRSTPVARTRCGNGNRSALRPSCSSRPSGSQPTQRHWPSGAPSSFVA